MDGKREVDQNSVLWRCFQIFKNKSEVKLTTSHLLGCLQTDLGVRLDGLPNDLQAILPYALVIYIKKWINQLPKNSSIDFTSLDRFFTFRDYLVHKIINLITIGYQTAIQEIQNESKPSSEFSPYNILIECPPMYINSFVFSNNDDDVILKHHLHKRWKELTMSELVNWPFIQIQFKTRELAFVRTQSSEVIRYLNLSPYNNLKQSTDRVEKIEKVGTAARACYTVNYIATYIKEYIKVLQQMKSLEKDVVEEISVILSEFVEDVKGMSTETIATNTKILLKYSGNQIYIRNKKLVSNQNVPQRLGLCEMIIPKVEFTIDYFNVKQVYGDESSDFCFDITNELKKMVNASIKTVQGRLPIILYKCTYCDKDTERPFRKRDEIVMHLMVFHRMEHPVRCKKCTTQYDFTSLVKSRWKHSCHRRTASGVGE